MIQKHKHNDAITFDFNIMTAGVSSKEDHKLLITLTVVFLRIIMLLSLMMTNVAACDINIMVCINIKPMDDKITHHTKT